MKKKVFLTIFWTIFLFFFLSIQAGAETGPDKVTIGIYITSLYDIDFTDGSYTVIFWVWWKSKLKYYDPANCLEVINAKEYSCLNSYTKKYKDWFYLIAKYSAKINQSWITENYPFDRQNLKIILESVGMDSTQVLFTPDLTDSVINPEIELKLWKIGNLSLTATNYQYPSGFGEEHLKQEIYPRLIVNLPIQRIGYRIFIASFIGFIISFFITALLYFIHPEDIASRLSLSLAALFATVGNKYTIDTTLPMGSTFSLADTIGISTFVIVIISIFTTIVCPWLIREKKIRTAKIINWTAFFLSCPAYILLIISTLFFNNPNN